MIVLILVVVDNGHVLGLEKMLKQDVSEVLILVVVDNGHVRDGATLKISKKMVLILVVVDNGHVLSKDRIKLPDAPKS